MRLSCPEALADEFWRHFAQDRWENNVGKVKPLRQLLRLAPARRRGAPDEAMLKLVASV